MLNLKSGTQKAEWLLKPIKGIVHIDVGVRLTVGYLLCIARVFLEGEIVEQVSEVG